MRYVSTHNKMYATVEEFALRQSLFAAFDEFVQTANAANASANESYRAAHNVFSDWTREEKDKLLGLKNMTLPEFTEKVDKADISNYPPAFNWCT